MPNHIPSLVVELCPLGTDVDAYLAAAASAANAAQTEFLFELTPVEERTRCRAYREAEYRAEKVRDWLIEYRESRHTPQRAFIGFVDQPLRSERLAGLFASHFAEKQIAVVTLQKVAHFDVAPVDYVLYYLIRYTLSFLAPDLKVHASRNCYFDAKIVKRKILESMDSGRLCDYCDQYLKDRLSPRQHPSVRKLAAVLHKQRTAAHEAATTVFSWVQLSDIHFGDGPEHWKINKEHMVADIVRDLKECKRKPDRIFVTGDIAFSGKPKQFDQAFVWLQKVATALALPLGAIRLIPGNHDVNRAIATKPVVQPLHVEARRVPEKLDQFVADATARRILRKKLEAYSKFVARFPSRPPALTHGIDWIEELPATSRRGPIRILGLASTWVSDAVDGREHDKGKVFVPNLLLCEAQFRSLVTAEGGDLVLVLTHHPPEWLHSSSRRLLAQRLARLTSIHLCGHVHESTAGSYQAFGTDHAAQHAVAGAVHGEHDEVTDHSYSWGAIRWSPAGSGGRWEFGLSNRVYAKAGRFKPDSRNYSPDSDGFEWREIGLPWPIDGVTRSSSAEIESVILPEKTRAAGQSRPTREAAAKEPRMTDELGRPPRAFLSYAWESDELKTWVKEFASTLRNDGVETILDQWHAVPGDQLPAFMERSVRENDFVLIICTPQYKKKSEERIGGVGYEGDVMTAEIYGKNNHRKFIHILREVDWKTSVPTWLAGKYGIDLRGTPFKPERYQDLLTTLLGNREVPPAVRSAVTKQEAVRQPERNKGDQDADPEPVPVRVLGVIADEVTEPVLDGTRGSALYVIPFRLSCTPSSAWATAFHNAWQHPPEYTLMHRPKIARVSGDRIVLDGTTVEEVESTHRKTLLLCVAKASEIEVELWRSKRKKAEEERQRREQHITKVAEAAARLNFDKPAEEQGASNLPKKPVSVERISAIVGGECVTKHTEECRSRRGATSLWPIRGPGWQHNVCTSCVDAKVRDGEWSVMGEDLADKAVHEELRHATVATSLVRLGVPRDQTLIESGCFEEDPDRKCIGPIISILNLSGAEGVGPDQIAIEEADHPPLLPDYVVAEASQTVVQGLDGHKAALCAAHKLPLDVDRGKITLRVAHDRYSSKIAMRSVIDKVRQDLARGVVRLIENERGQAPGRQYLPCHLHCDGLVLTGDKKVILGQRSSEVDIDAGQWAASFGESVEWEADRVGGALHPVRTVFRGLKEELGLPIDWLRARTGRQPQVTFLDLGFQIDSLIYTLFSVVEIPEVGIDEALERARNHHTDSEVRRFAFMDFSIEQCVTSIVTGFVGKKALNYSSRFGLLLACLDRFEHSFVQTLSRMEASAG